ncbi:endonuclease/exonuclease/phosphatase family protein [Streptomyces sp. WMMC500]|uniref:endonuclease/exonuclease/phosphatase family protein n=1 Tax=Streptomyces sp. WMMC500 TaxID=3015154 RepID=UPI00248BEBA7|nr:endonuclease/exonuclease/phosphatase family protein [Streptomyces sp. WMMC500]WBB64705.1 endonuclease/exonuclease/phosphatase family protein [Streptomyces sp. WMMC500]
MRRAGGDRRDAGPGGRLTAPYRAARALGRPAPWRRGWVLAALALLLGLTMMLHAAIPSGSGNPGSLVETFLPWFGLPVFPLLAGALWRRSASAVVALVLPVTVWLSLFGGLLADKSRPGADLTVASHNVGAANPDPAGTARDLAASGADLLALQEVTPTAQPLYAAELAKTYPYHTTLGTVGLWSRLPLSDTRPVDIAMQPSRALRTTVATERGPLAVYVAHLGSVRMNPRAGLSTAQRDDGAQRLAAAVAAEPNDRVVVLGDLNGTVDDRAFDDLTGQVRSAQEEAGNGFGFSWPAGFPVARIDQILVRGLEPRSSWVLPATGSDHLPVAAGVAW